MATDEFLSDDDVSKLKTVLAMTEAALKRRVIVIVAPESHEGGLAKIELFTGLPNDVTAELLARAASMNSLLH